MYWDYNLEPPDDYDPEDPDFEEPEDYVPDEQDAAQAEDKWMKQRGLA